MQAKLGEVVVQNSGTLNAMPLESILETIQKDRATGTLRLSGSEGEATLFFLFGHLFHATDANRQGEPVVYDALGWQQGDFTFDSKAKLPAEETIKVSTAELLANRAAGSVAAPPTETTEEEAAAKAAATEVLAEAEKSGIVPPAEEMPVAQAAPAPETMVPATMPFVAPPPPSMAPPAEAAVAAAEPAPVAAVAPELAPAPEPVAAPVAAAAPAGPIPRRRRTDKRPGTRPPETMELYPVPPGDMVYEALTAAFVDFPKLLRSLAKDQHSGYVRLSGEGFKSVLLFSSGAVVEAIYDGHGQVRTGVDAFQLFGKDIDNSEGSLDVIRLTPEMVTAIFQLLTAPSLYDKLTARFVKVDALLEHLSEEGLSGSVIMRLEHQTGVVLYRKGTILGCYTDSDPSISTDLDKVLAICGDDSTAIEVRGGPAPEVLPVLQPGDSGVTTVPAGSSQPAEASNPAPAPASLPEPEPVPAPAAEAAPEVAPGPAAAAVASATADPAPEVLPPPAASAVPAYAAASPINPSGLNGDTAGGGTGEVDWATLISAMAGRADAVLGTRSKKVKELLYAAGHNRDDVDGTIERISELSIMFVDPSKLTALAADMRQIAAAAH
jgi:hypothetical protein